MNNDQNQTPMGQNLTQNQAQVPQQTVPSQSAQSITQQPQEQMPQAVVPPKNGHIVRTLLIMIILAIIVFLLVLIYLSVVNKQPSNSYSIQIENTTSPVPTKSAEQELNSIDVGDVEDDLKEVDADLQGL